ncbi:MAG: diguanylate cyclase [Oscillospiraceae bacterium]|nr:diguanylate cyclase [Oscillospiraceae bacterium]
MDHLIRTGGIGECEFRLLRKEGEPVWTLIKSRLYVETDGQEYFYIAVRDNSRSKALQQSLQSTAERNRTIIEQADGIIFEWDFATDVMHCSPKWEEHFGYPPVSKNYSAQMGIATHFHPDDLPAIREYIARLRAGQTTAALDVRIATGDGHYLWYKITGTLQKDENGAPVRIIGMLQNIDELKRAAITLREQAERDALTKLLNKASSQRLISEYLLEREPSAMAALLVLDLDNFKGVNDTYGHLYGDAMLAQIGATLRRLFRSNDVIGRIGGDEFVILLRDIPDEKILHSRCELLLETFRELFGRIAPALPVSLSIGAAFAPVHGTSYADLFHHADEALYQAKNEGKNTYCVYDPQEQFDLLLGSGRANTRIDSDEQPGMANDSFARFVFRRLYEGRDFTTAINEILAYIGQQFNVSRVYIFENDETNEYCSNTFEWCNKGIVPQIHELQNISYEKDIKGWREAFDERGILYCQDISTLEPHIRAIVEPQGIKSMLHCAIMDGGVFRGYVGFDECTQTRMWTQDQVNLLEFLAQMQALFLIKERTRSRTVSQMMNMQNMLDAQNAWIYVVDPESCEMQFLNKGLRRIAPESYVGQKCYKAIMGRDERCENCPAKDLHAEEIRNVTLDNPKIGKKMHVRASHLLWNGKDACLLTDDRCGNKMK